MRLIVTSINFKGKNSVVSHHLAVGLHRLVPNKNKSVLARGEEPNLNGSIILHGDNLLALKALLPTHAGRVNCIYIDPPYNTGNEGWCYNDNMNNPMMREWFGKAVDRDDLTRHDKWCCMMYPRLSLLHELLAEDGVIIISIDDNEHHRLRMLMDEIFGEENFIIDIVWRKKTGGGQDSQYLAREHEYIVAYCKSGDFKINHRTKIVCESEYNKKVKGRKCKFINLEKWGSNALKTDRPTMYYPIKDPDGNDFYPQAPQGQDGNWRKNPTLLDEDHICWERNDRRGRWTPKEVVYFDEAPKEKIIKDRSIFYDLAYTSDATDEQVAIFGEKRFDHTKPVDLIRRLLQISTRPDSIVLDSFAGSGTTAHAVLELNKEDGGKRQFILVECENYADEVTAERVRRVIKGIRGVKSENLQEGLGGTFSYWKLGEELKLQSILSAETLPEYDELAAYLFHNATGVHWNKAKARKRSCFLGATDQYEVFLFYQPDIQYIQNTSVTLEFLDKMPKNSSGKPRLIFAPVCYVKTSDLRPRNVVFCQLPYAIYRAVGKVTQGG